MRNRTPVARNCRLTIDRPMPYLRSRRGAARYATPTTTFATAMRGPVTPSPRENFRRNQRENRGMIRPAPMPMTKFDAKNFVRIGADFRGRRLFPRGTRTAGSRTAEMRIGARAAATRIAGSGGRYAPGTFRGARRYAASGGVATRLPAANARGERKNVNPNAA